MEADRIRPNPRKLKGDSSVFLDVLEGISFVCVCVHVILCVCVVYVFVYMHVGPSGW